jgi:WD40 repeat protein
MALRGHVDSVNHVQWQPCSAALCTASSDKTVSVWDARSGLCTQTFYGHANSCNAAVFNLAGTVVASTDADGVVKLWDTRMVAEITSVSTGKHAANKAAFDHTGQVCVQASPCPVGLTAFWLPLLNGRESHYLVTHCNADAVGGM